MLDMKLNTGSSDITGTKRTQLWYQIYQINFMETK